jgi:TPR repeat protein
MVLNERKNSNEEMTIKVYLELLADTNSSYKSKFRDNLDTLSIHSFELLTTMWYCRAILRKTIQIGDSTFNIDCLMTINMHKRKIISVIRSLQQTHEDKFTGTQCYEKAFSYCLIEECRLAAKWYEKAIEKGNPLAMSSLGDMRYRGSGGFRNLSLGIELLKNAAERGNYNSMYILGFYKDNEEKIVWYLQAAKLGHPLAQNKMGEYYLVNGNDVEAIKWQTMAAEQGNIESQRILGVLFNENNDEKEAIKWFQMAVEQGDIESMIGLGNIHNNHSQIPEALKYYLLAAEKGDSFAQYLSAEEYVLLKNDTEAVKWYELAAAQGEIDAMYKLAVYYEVGRVVKQDKEKAKALYKKAAKKNHKLAKLALKRLKNE